jgi:glucan 1,3-beta-glucosidase
MQILRQKNMLEDIEEHRRTYLGRTDFQQIKRCGLNAVRLPIGYWIVIGPSDGDPYCGPALEFIDQAVEWADEFGLQIVLDLHAAPGGESGDAPSGRVQDRWHWTQWRFHESLRALEVLAKRYCNCRNVTGIEVCNEPSLTLPGKNLRQFYSQAVTRIRACGMSEDRVAVILPVFQRHKASFIKEWEATTGGIHKNVVFDFHYYHCFGTRWDNRTIAQQLRAVERHAAELCRYPAVVGEWSLALGRNAREGLLHGEELRALFGRLQLKAYANASHGWFFWNWKDAHGIEWNWQEGFQEGAMLGNPPALPFWDGHGEDPLEVALTPSCSSSAPRFFDWTSHDSMSTKVLSPVLTPQRHLRSSSFHAAVAVLATLGVQTPEKNTNCVHHAPLEQRPPSPRLAGSDEKAAPSRSHSRERSRSRSRSATSYTESISGSSEVSVIG